jgi:hypothetical protein
MTSIAPSDQKPRTIGRERGCHSSQQGKEETEFVLGRERSSRQQDGRGRQWNSQLLSQNPDKKQQIPIMDQELHRQSHTKASFQFQQSDTLSAVHREPMKEKKSLILCDDLRRRFGSSNLPLLRISDLPR